METFPPMAIIIPPRRLCFLPWNRLNWEIIYLIGRSKPPYWTVCCVKTWQRYLSLISLCLCSIARFFCAFFHSVVCYLCSRHSCVCVVTPSFRNSFMSCLVCLLSFTVCFRLLLWCLLLVFPSFVVCSLLPSSVGFRRCVIFVCVRWSFWWVADFN